MVYELKEATSGLGRRASGGSTSLAFVGLAAVDLILKFAGFRRLYQTVKLWPVRKGGDNNPQRIAAVCSAVDQAGTYYPKQAQCLQRSAVVTCLLRMKGVDAQLVIGCRKIPFRGHAWVEVDGIPVNDGLETQSLYEVLTRC
jgi:Transglutaminase-like superfamily